MCRIQNQTGRFPIRWDKTGVVVQVGENDQYIVKVDGSGRLTLRNRKYLRKVDSIRKPSWKQIVPVNECYDSQEIPQTPSPSVQTFEQPVSLPVERTSQELSNPPVESRDAIEMTEPSTFDQSRNAIEMTEPSTFDQSRNAIEMTESSTQLKESVDTRPRREKKAPKWHDDYQVGALHVDVRE